MEALHSIFLQLGKGANTGIYMQYLLKVYIFLERIYNTYTYYPDTEGKEIKIINWKRKAKFFTAHHKTWADHNLNISE